MAFFAYYFDWDSILGVLFGVLGVLFGILGVLFGVLCILFGLLGVFFAVLGVFILWINFPKNSPFRVLCGKGTPAWKRYTTAGCGGCDNYEVCFARVILILMNFWILHWTYLQVVPFCSLIPKQFFFAVGHFLPLVVKFCRQCVVLKEY